MRRLLLLLVVLVAGSTFVVYAQTQTPTQKLDAAIALINEVKAMLNQPPPTAVDCQVSAWTLQSATAWGTCTNGTQTRTETWARTITQQPANGGAACPVLTETRTGTQACGVTPPPPTGTPTITGLSGTLANGSTVTLTGSNYGTKAAQQPWKWDDMNGANGARLEPRGWLVHQNTPQPLLSTAQKRPGRTSSVLLAQTGGDVPDFAFGDNGGGYFSFTTASNPNLRTPPTTLLIDYWMYFTNGPGMRNYKFWRWYTFRNPDSDNRYWGMPGGSTADESSEHSYFNAIGIATLNNKWTHHRLYLHPDSIQANVYFQHSIDQRVYMNTGTSGDYVPPDPGFTAGPWPTVASGDRLSTFLFEMQSLDGGSPVTKMYISDVVVDDGYGAVYLGSASTWASSTHTEYQPYSSWANTILSVKVNRGTFGVGPAWLYVVNNGRLMNATGFPVSLP